MEIVSILANSADPDELLRYAPFVVEVVIVVVVVYKFSQSRDTFSRGGLLKLCKYFKCQSPYIYFETCPMNECLMLVCASVHLPGCISISFGDQGKFIVLFSLEAVAKTSGLHMEVTI